MSPNRPHLLVFMVMLSLAQSACSSYYPNYEAAVATWRVQYCSLGDALCQQHCLIRDASDGYGAAPRPYVSNFSSIDPAIYDPPPPPRRGRGHHHHR